MLYLYHQTEYVQDTRGNVLVVSRDMTDVYKYMNASSNFEIRGEMLWLWVGT